MSLMSAAEKLASFFQWYGGGAIHAAAKPLDAASITTPATTIVLEGAPCVGKTTLVQALARRRSAAAEAVAVEEERDDLLLDAFLKDPPRFAFLFQMYKLARRQQLCSDLAHAQVARPHTRYLLDRMLAGDMCFALHQYVVGHFTREQLALYVTRALRVVQPHAWRTVYLTASPARQVARVKRRGNPDEMRLYDEAYFERMDVCLRWAFAVLHVPYVEVDWDADAALDAESRLSEAVCDAVLAIIQ